MWHGLIVAYSLINHATLQIDPFTSSFVRCGWLRGELANLEYRGITIEADVRIWIDEGFVLLHMIFLLLGSNPVFFILAVIVGGDYPSTLILVDISPCVIVGIGGSLPFNTKK